MRKFLKHIHLWLSLPAGIFIAVMCLTGAVLVFQQEIQRAVSPGFYFTDRYREVKEPLPLDALVCAAAEELSGEGRKISSVTVYSNPESTVAVGVSGQKGARRQILHVRAQPAPVADADRYGTDCRKDNNGHLFNNVLHHSYKRDIYSRSQSMAQRGPMETGLVCEKRQDILCMVVYFTPCIRLVLCSVPSPYVIDGPDVEFQLVPQRGCRHIRHREYEWRQARQRERYTQDSRRRTAAKYRFR